MELLREIRKYQPNRRQALLNLLLILMELKKEKDEIEISEDEKTISFIIGYTSITGDCDSDEEYEASKRQTWELFERILYDDQEDLLCQVIEFKSYDIKGLWYPTLKIVLYKATVDNWLKEKALKNVDWSD